MAIYIDNVCIKHNGQEWCHMVADTLDELHQFAKQLGLKRNWFQNRASYPHYDVTANTRKKALLLGARPGTRKEIIHCAKKLKKQYIFYINARPKQQLSLF